MTGRDAMCFECYDYAMCECNIEGNQEFCWHGLTAEDQRICRAVAVEMNVQECYAKVREAFDEASKEE